MDPRTALIVAILMILANGGVLSLVRRHFPPDLRPATASWLASIIFVALGCIAFLAHDHLPAILVLPLANALLMLGLAGCWRALRQFYGAPPNDAALLLAVLVGTSGILVFSTFHPQPKLRIVIASAVWIFLMMGSFMTMKERGCEDASLSRKALMAISATVVVFCILRAIYYCQADLPPGFSVIDDTNLMNRLTPVIAVMLPIVGTTAFLLMCYERSRQLSGASAGQAYNRHKAETLSYIGHDLRAPLATIVGYIRLLRQTGTPEQAAHIRAIERSASYQLTLIDEILEFARHELKPLDVRRVPVRLAELLEDIAQQAYGLSLQHNNRYEFRAETPLPAHILTDPRRLQQVLLNLISNAAKFTHGGTIGLTVRAGKEQNATMLEFAVADSGAGIDPKIQSAIFQPFEQARPRPGSVGLGLHIAYSIVKNLGGELRLESRPGAGSCFSFEIPVELLSDKTMTLRSGPATRAPDAGPSAAACATASMPPAQLREELATLARNGRLTDIEDWLQRHSESYPGRHADYFDAIREALQRLDFHHIESMALAGIK